MDLTFFDSCFSTLLPGPNHPAFYDFILLMKVSKGYHGTVIVIVIVVGDDGTARMIPCTEFESGDSD